MRSIALGDVDTITQSKNAACGDNSREQPRHLSEPQQLIALGRRLVVRQCGYVEFRFASAHFALCFGFDDDDVPLASPSLFRLQLGEAQLSPPRP